MEMLPALGAEGRSLLSHIFDVLEPTAYWQQRGVVLVEALERHRLELVLPL